MPNNCCVCGSMGRCLHRFPKDPTLRKKWLDNLNLREEDIGSEARVCVAHFRDGIPSLSIGWKFSDSCTSTPRSKLMKMILVMEVMMRSVRPYHTILTCISLIPRPPSHMHFDLGLRLTLLYYEKKKLYYGKILWKRYYENNIRIHFASHEAESLVNVWVI